MAPRVNSASTSLRTDGLTSVSWFQRGAAVADHLPHGCLVMDAVSVRPHAADEEPGRLGGGHHVVHGRGVDFGLAEREPTGLGVCDGVRSKSRGSHWPEASAEG